MRYYVVADIHGFYTPLTKALTKAGFYTDASPRKLIVCGDIFDRGLEALAMQEFILDLMDKDEVILVRGNHEDLFVDLLNEDGGIPYRHHVSNGTYSTALQLTGYDRFSAHSDTSGFVRSARVTPYYQRIIPSTVDYFEAGEYIFVHGWIPVNTKSVSGKTIWEYDSDWRNASKERWETARWNNGMNASLIVKEPDKTIVCGHWHCSYGHYLFEKKCSEFGDDADFTPYYGKGIIAIDACTVHSGFVNCLVIDV